VKWDVSTFSVQHNGIDHLIHNQKHRYTRSPSRTVTSSPTPSQCTDKIMALQQACKDFHACKWPEGLGNDNEDLALYFDKLNDKNHDAIEEIKRNSKQILTFSHFVPRLALVAPDYEPPIPCNLSYVTSACYVIVVLPYANL
jgi:hypothetical protein